MENTLLCFSHVLISEKFWFFCFLGKHNGFINTSLWVLLILWFFGENTMVLSIVRFAWTAAAAPHHFASPRIASQSTHYLSVLRKRNGFTDVCMYVVRSWSELGFDSARQPCVRAVATRPIEA